MRTKCELGVSNQYPSLNLPLLSQSLMHASPSVSSPPKNHSQVGLGLSLLLVSPGFKLTVSSGKPHIANPFNGQIRNDSCPGYSIEQPWHASQCAVPVSDARATTSVRPRRMHCQGTGAASSSVIPPPCVPAGSFAAGVWEMEIELEEAANVCTPSLGRSH